MILLLWMNVILSGLQVHLMYLQTLLERTAHDTLSYNWIGHKLNRYITFYTTSDFLIVLVQENIWSTLFWFGTTTSFSYLGSNTSVCCKGMSVLGMYGTWYQPKYVLVCSWVLYI